MTIATSNGRSAFSKETQREPAKWRLGGGSPPTSLGTLLVFQTLTPLNLQPTSF